MLDTPKEFLKGWRESFIDNEVVEEDDIDSLMAELLEDADEDGISKQELEKAANGDLRGYLRTALHARVKELETLDE